MSPLRHASVGIHETLQIGDSVPDECCRPLSDPEGPAKGWEGILLGWMRSTDGVWERVGEMGGRDEGASGERTHGPGKQGHLFVV